MIAKQAVLNRANVAVAIRVCLEVGRAVLGKIDLPVQSMRAKELARMIGASQRYGVDVYGAKILGKQVNTFFDDIPCIAVHGSIGQLNSPLIRYATVAENVGNLYKK